MEKVVVRSPKQYFDIYAMNGIGKGMILTTSILCNGWINAKKVAALASAYSGSAEALKKVEEKMTEQIVNETETEMEKEGALNGESCCKKCETVL